MWIGEWLFLNSFQNEVSKRLQTKVLSVSNPPLMELFWRIETTSRSSRSTIGLEISIESLYSFKSTVCTVLYTVVF